MSVRVDDYSTETGLRVRMTCDTTSTAIQIPADEWWPLVADIKAGVHDEVAKEPNTPFIY